MNIIKCIKHKGMDRLTWETNHFIHQTADMKAVGRILTQMLKSRSLTVWLSLCEGKVIIKIKDEQKENKGEIWMKKKKEGSMPSFQNIP